MSIRKCGTCERSIDTDEEEYRQEAGLFFHPTWRDCQAAMERPSAIRDAARAYRRKQRFGKNAPHPTLSQLDDEWTS